MFGCLSSSSRSPPSAWSSSFIERRTFKASHTLTIDRFLDTIESKEVGFEQESAAFAIRSTDSNGQEQVDVFKIAIGNLENSICFLAKTCSPRELNVTVEFFLRGKSLHRKIGVFKSHTSWTCPITFTKKDFGSRLKRLLKNGRLILTCEIQVHHTDKPRVTESFCPIQTFAQVFLDVTPTMSDDFKSAMNARFLFDVTVCAGTKRIGCHRVILAARSSVFRSLFSDHQRRTEDREIIEISIFEANTVEKLITWIYCEEIDEPNDLEVLAAARHFKVERLFAVCELALCQNLTVDNVAENFCQAILQQAQNLKKQSGYFIKTHKKAVILTQGWKSIPQKYPGLIEQIIVL